MAVVGRTLSDAAHSYRIKCSKKSNPESHSKFALQGMKCSLLSRCCLILVVLAMVT